MMPWEKYAATTEGPWSKYGSPEETGENEEVKPDAPDFSLGRLGSQMYRNAAQGVSDVARATGAARRTDATGIEAKGRYEESVPTQGLFETREQVGDAVDRGELSQEDAVKILKTGFKFQPSQQTTALAESTREKAKPWEAFAASMPEPLEGSPDGLLGIVEQAAGGMARFAPSMAVSALNLPTGTAMTFSQLHGSKFDELKKKGVDDQRANEAAMIGAAIMTPIEQAGTVVGLGALKNLFKSSAKGFGAKAKQFVGALLKSSAAEGIEEYLQQYPDEISTLWATNPDKNPEELASLVIQELPRIKEEAKQSAIVGAVGGAMMAGGGQVASIPFKGKVEEIEAQPTMDGKVQAAELQASQDTAPTPLQKIKDSAGKLTSPNIKTLPTGKKLMDPMSPDIKTFEPHGRPSTAKEAAGVFKSTQQQPAEASYGVFEQEGLTDDPIVRAQKQNQAKIDRTNIDAENEIERNKQVRQQIADEAAKRKAEQPVDTQKQQQEIELLTDILANSEDKAARQAIATEMKRRLKPADQGTVEPQAHRPVTAQPTDAGMGTTLPAAAVPDSSQETATPPRQTAQQPSPVVDSSQPAGEGIPQSAITEQRKQAVTPQPLSETVNGIGKSGRREVVADPGGAESVTPDRRLKPLDVIKDRREKADRRVEDRDAAALPSETVTTENELQERVSKETRKATGRVWTGNQWRPIVDQRNVLRGKKKGMVQVTYPGGKRQIVPKESLRDVKLSTKSEDPGESAQSFSAQFPGVEMKYDGEFDRSAINKPPMYQFTPQAGPIKGATFNVQDPTVEAVRKRYNEMAEMRKAPKLATKQEPGSVTNRKVVYRASNDEYVSKGYSFAEDIDSAKEYTDNPNFGGKNLYSISIPDDHKILDLTEEDDPWAKLSEIAGKEITPDMGQYEISQAIQNIPDLMAQMSEAGYDWVRYADDFPKGSITYTAVSDKIDDLEIGDYGQDISTKQTQGTKASITPEQVQKAFKGFKAEIDGDTVSVKTPRGRLTINVAYTIVEDDKVAIKLAYGRDPITDDDGNVIERVAGASLVQDKTETVWLKRNIADSGTLAHELLHIAKGSGLLSPMEEAVLRRAAGTDEEAQARWVEKKVRDRANVKGIVGRVIQKLSDFFDAFKNLFTTTELGVVRSLESGKVLKRKGGDADDGVADLSTRNQTESEAFKKWFSKSKVVDADGNPMVVYHGTYKAGFDQFKDGSHFTENPEYASIYVNPSASSMGSSDKRVKSQAVYPVYISMQNPFDTRKAENKKLYNKFTNSYGNGTPLSERGLPDWTDSYNLIEWIEETGQPFDGLVLDEGGTPEGGWRGVSYVPIKPNQIKSATGNTGAFDHDNPDIRYSTKASSYQDTKGPVTDEDYEAVLNTKKNLKVAAAVGTSRIASEIKEGVDKYLGAISSRLERINPKIKYKMREMESKTGVQNTKDIKAVEPLLLKAKKAMTRKDFIVWDYARKNSDTKKINELIEKYDLQKEYNSYRSVLDNIHERAYDVGLVLGRIEEYAPRILKDSRGFLRAIEKDPEWDIITRRLKQKAKQLDIPLDQMNPDQRAQIISQMIMSGQYGLGGPAATKERKLDKIPAYLNRYYMDSDSSLVAHIYGMNKSIEARRFFGNIPKDIAEIRTRLLSAQRKIRAVQSGMQKLDDEAKKKAQAKLARLRSLEDDYQDQLEKYATQRDFRDNIGVYVDNLRANKEITGGDEQALIDILNARFHDRGAHGIVQAYKNFSYIDTMGSFTSAITQVGDLAWSAYEGGMIKSLKHAYKAFRKQSRITKEDIGIERVAQEFEDSTTLGKAVNKVFKYVGLEKMDTIGKESLLNAAHDKFKSRAKKDPGKLKSEIKPIFEGETDSVIKDLLEDNITDNVKLLVYNRLLDFQPVALSEMPEKYLTAGNGRVFYMLKTFTMKQFDVYRKEVYNKLRYGDKGEKIQAMKNLARLSMFFVLANAGADELKDFILGRKTDFDDRVTDNVLRLFGVSKFITWQARTEGVGTAMAKQILPPFKFINAISKDIMSDSEGSETLASVPIVGKLAYWHMGKGVNKREDLWDGRLRKEKSKLNEIKQELEESDNPREFRRKHAKELNRLKKVNSLQYRLNKYRKEYKALEKKAPQKKNVIEKLKERRTNEIKRFLDENG